MRAFAKRWRFSAPIHYDAYLPDLWSIRRRPSLIASSLGLKSFYGEPGVPPSVPNESLIVAVEEGNCVERRIALNWRIISG
jgi:hypothetical protein